MNTVTLPTTPEQREALAALGLTLWGEVSGIEERWEYSGDSCLQLVQGREPVFHHSNTPIALGAQALQILGLLPPPPGMVLIPRDVAVRAEAALMHLANDMGISAVGWDKKKMPGTAEACRHAMAEADCDRGAILEAIAKAQATTSPIKE